MKILSDNDIELLNILINNEVEFIEKGFMISELIGLMFLRNSIKSFLENYLYKIYGNCIPSFSSEYRYFVIGLINNINSKYYVNVIKELLIPNVGMLDNTELLSYLNQIGKI